MQRAPVQKNRPKRMMETKRAYSKGANEADAFQCNWSWDGLKEVGAG